MQWSSPIHTTVSLVQQHEWKIMNQENQQPVAGSWTGPVRIFKVTKWVVISVLVFSIIVVLIGLGMFVFGIYKALTDSNRGMGFLGISSAVGIFCVSAGAFLFLRASKQVGLQVLLFEEGIVLCRGQIENRIRWSSIEKIWVKSTFSATKQQNIATGLTGSHLIYTLEFLNGPKHRLFSYIANLEELGNMIQDKARTAAFPNAKKSIQDNVPLDFGSIKADAAGISRGRSRVPWEDIEGIDDDSCVLYNKDGKTKKWYSLDNPYVCNQLLLLSLIKWKMNKSARV